MKVFSCRLSAPLVALLAAVTLFALFAVNVMSLAAIHSSRLSFARTRRAQALLDSIRADIADAETGQRGFLLTGRGDYLERFQSAIDEIPRSLAELRGMVGPGRQRDVRELQGLTVKKLDELRFTIDLQLHHETAAALAIVRSDEGKRLMDRIRTLLADLREEEEHGVEARMVAARRRLDRALWIDAFAGTALLLLGALLFRISRDIARREQLERDLREEVYLREQFVGILGHDLRNPLSAIMMSGRRLNGPLVSSEVSARAGQIISSAAHRMRRMVDELLDLTRARRAGGIVIQRRPATDLVRVARCASEELRERLTETTRADAFSPDVDERPVLGPVGPDGRSDHPPIGAVPEDPEGLGGCRVVGWGPQGPLPCLPIACSCESTAESMVQLRSGTRG